MLFTALFVMKEEYYFRGDLLAIMVSILKWETFYILIWQKKM